MKGSCRLTVLINSTLIIVVFWGAALFWGQDRGITSRASGGTELRWHNGRVVIDWLDDGRGSRVQFLLATSRTCRSLVF